ncbi:UNVERIFIED_CONTAM: frpA [Trichonephila clavipes]
MATLTAFIPDDVAFNLTARDSVVFSAATGNPVTVASDSSAEFYAAVWVVNGSLTLGNAGGVELVKTYDDATTNFYGLLVKGTAEAINAAFDGLAYTTFSTDTVQGNIGYPAPWTPTGHDDMLMVYVSDTEPADEDVVMNMDYMLNIDILADDDTTGPVVTLTGADENATQTTETSATFAWEGQDDTAIARYEYSLDGGASWMATAATSVTLTDLTAGSQSFILRAVDTLGNTGAAVTDSWMVQVTNMMKATAEIDVLVGGAGDDILVPQHAADIPGDTYDGGAGYDILKITTSMMMIDLPANGFDFTRATVLGIEELSFNYMPMPMPGQVIFSSDQFGAGLISNDLVVRGTWGSNDIVVNLVDGDSRFDASGWSFPVAYMGLSAGETATTEIVDGVPTGNASSMWGHYIYTGSRSAYVGHDVGAGSEPVLGGWDHGVVYANGMAGDTIRLFGSEGANRITGTAVEDHIYGAAGADTLSGYRGDDRIWGGGKADRLLGGAGDDTLSGGTGGDTLRGQSGDDRLNGGKGADHLDGGAGADTLVGGDGRDMLTGGAGGDLFVFSSAGHSAPDGASRDLVTDFTQGEDLIDLAGLGRLHWQGDAAFDGAAGALRASVTGDTTLIEADLDGDGRADFSLELTGQHQLLASDFLL